MLFFVGGNFYELSSYEVKEKFLEHSEKRHMSCSCNIAF